MYPPQGSMVMWKPSTAAWVMRGVVRQQAIAANKSTNGHRWARMIRPSIHGNVYPPTSSESERREPRQCNAAVMPWEKRCVKHPVAGQVAAIADLATAQASLGQI